MKIPAGLEVGVDSHTGRARASNEDDFLLYAPDAATQRDEVGTLIAVADGMGGVSGGAEASRAAVRALLEGFVLPGTGDSAKARLERAFGAACQRVFQAARVQPRLRDMGTTLTVLNINGPVAVIGHVGDSRCYLLRKGELRQLTTDHAVRSAEHQLTRCVGAGRDAEIVDIDERAVEADDVFLLCTDGLWDALATEEVRQVLGGAPQVAASTLVRRAVELSGVDNATAVVVRVRSIDPPGQQPLVDVDLPAREVTRLPRLTAPLPDMRRPRWPWTLLVFAVGVAAAAAARAWFAVDLLGLLVAG